MATPLIMLAILAVPLLVVYMLRLRGLQIGRGTGGVIGLVLVLLFTASGHFVRTEPMAAMLPSFVPARVPLIYLTGLWEIALAIGIALPATRRHAGLAGIATLILFFPVNVYAAFAHVDMGGHAWGPAYLLVRAPLQALLVAWTWWFAARPVGPVGTKGPLPRGYENISAHNPLAD